MSFHVLFFAGLSGDLDLLLDYQCMCFDKTHFPNVNRLYGNFSKMISFMWGFYVRYCGGVGFIYQMSGKFSRHLLTQARTRTTRLGKTSFAIVDHNIIYRYGQTHSETGAYGINLFFFTQNRFKLKSKHP